MASAADSDPFDAIVLGAGPAGEVVATRLGECSMRTALVEAELIGGECAYWACIPSKTLLHPGEVSGEAERAPGGSRPELRWGEIAEYRDFMIRGLDDSKEIKSYEQLGVTVIKGAGKLGGPWSGGRRRAHPAKRADRDRDRERAADPGDRGLEQAGFWTNREATTFAEVPDSAVILGGGPVGIEFAQMLCRFGCTVELVERADRLLAREDGRVGELIEDALRHDGIRSIPAPR